MVTVKNMSSNKSRKYSIFIAVFCQVNLKGSNLAVPATICVFLYSGKVVD